MKIVFVSNYFNHHQKPFCEYMYQKLGSDFVFISTAIMREERKKMGYLQDNPSYVHLAYDGQKQWDEAVSMINNADVVIAGSAPNDMLLNRIREGKLIFRYSERPFRKKISFLRRFYHAIRFRQRDLWKNNIYILCASAYAANDFASMKLYSNRMYKWGYFPETKKYNIEILLNQKSKNKILWCGRFIALKHPEVVVEVARRLKEENYNFVIEMIGQGEMFETIKTMIDDADLSDYVKLLGIMKPEQVREKMETAGIYMFTSNHQEGWGAVLNESMNSGCAVVACDAIGSVPFLIDNEKNGFTYTDGDIDSLYIKIKYLLDNPNEQERIGINAYHTITTMWNAEIAAERFIELSMQVQNNDYHNLYKEGPCSRMMNGMNV